MSEEQSSGAVSRDNSALYIPGAIIIAGAIIGIAVYAALSSGAGIGGSGGDPAAVDVNDVQTEGEPYIGDENAPVTLAYWFDYQCPFCKAVDVGGIPQIPIEPAMPRIIEEYVDTGKVKIVFKDFAFLSEDSTTAALYEQAVWKLYPEHFYEWHEAMFIAQDEEHGGFGDEDSIVALIRTIDGLDADRIKADVAANTQTYEAEIAADRAEASSFGIGGTPGFITGTTLIPGAAEFDSFQAAIDPQL